MPSGHRSKYCRALLAALCLSGGLSAPAAGQQIVTTVAELYSAVGAANGGSADKTILVADGTYTLNSGSLILGHGVTVRGMNGSRDAVILEGQGMFSTAVRQIFQVTGDDITLESMTLRLVKNHVIQIHGEAPYDADRVVLRDLRIQDAGEQLVKVSYSGTGTGYCDDGLIENCEFEYTAGIGPQWYIGGVDAHAARNWIVRGNTFRGIRSPESNVAEHAAHFWSHSENTIVERNVIINCDRGIGFGLGDRGHVGGVIRNNMIFHAELGASDRGDVSIELENSPGTKIYHNSIYQEHDYPAGISVRWSGSTNVHIANNLILKNGGLTNAVWQRDGSSALVQANVVGPLADWFVSPAQGDLHLNDAENASVVDQGMTLEGIPTDFDGDARPLGAGFDAGADEVGGGAFAIEARSWGAVKGSYR